MNRCFTNSLAMLLVCTSAIAAPPVELELATERGLQITAPHEWLQLLTSIGIDNVRIRGARNGDEPKVKNVGTAERSHYQVTGILTSRNELRLPGGTFKRSDRARLKDFFDQLLAEGSESLTAPRGMFGLTDKEINTVFADLSQPVNFGTNGQAPREIVDRLQPRFQGKFAIDPPAEERLRAGEPVTDDFAPLTAGTALAILLRNHGLVLRPEKPRGQPIAYRIQPAPADWLEASTLGKTSDDNLAHWPIGWELQATPGRTAPSLFEFLNAEIDGYTLEESLAAIGPRIKIPYYLDHPVLAARNIEPANIQVRVARTRTFYKRIVDLVLSQARLGSEIRLDESGKPFLWITR